MHLSWEADLGPGKVPRIRQLMNSEKVSPIIDAMSRSDEMLDILQALMGPEIYLFHSKLMMKAAHDGSFTPWHQDWGYWQHESLEPSHMNCMLFIDRADTENGSIRFVEGSHLRGCCRPSRLRFRFVSARARRWARRVRRNAARDGPGRRGFLWAAGHSRIGAQSVGARSPCQHVRVR